MLNLPCFIVRKSTRVLQEVTSFVDDDSGINPEEIICRVSSCVAPELIGINLTANLGVLYGGHRARSASKSLT